MGKYKKYAKTEQYMDQLKKFLPNNSTIPNSNQRNNNINDNTKLNNKNGLTNNYLKKEDSSFKLIMWEIFEAIKSFFNICKNFLIPSEIPLKIFVSFIILEVIYQGITLYLVRSISRLLEELFPIWNDLINMYIYIISNVQMVYIFICEGLLIFRFVPLKIFLYKKLNWLINMLTCIVIIFNAFAIKDLNYKVHRFYSKKLDDFANNNRIIKEHITNEYINLHISKNEDFHYYEFCYELEADSDTIQEIKMRFPYMNWKYNSYTNLYLGCRDITFQNNSILDMNSQNYFFKCDNKGDISTAPNVCVSIKYRQKRFSAQVRMAFYETIILILWNLYNLFSIRIIYIYYPNLRDENEKKNDYYNNSQRKNNKYDDDFNYSNETVTYKDINGKEINNEDVYEEDEEENEYEEEEESIKKVEKLSKDNLIKEFKIRKIRKRKLKSYKKKRKKRYKDGNIKNKNIYFDEEILNLDFFDSNYENEEDSCKNEDEEAEENLKIFSDKNLELEQNKEQNENNNNNDEISISDDNYYSMEKYDKDNNDIGYNYIDKINMINTFRRKTKENIEKYELFKRFYKVLFEKYVDMIKYKIQHIFININKNLVNKDY